MGESLLLYDRDPDLSRDFLSNVFLCKCHRQGKGFHYNNEVFTEENRGNRGTSMKKIGVLTSGGDCAGLNAVIRAVTARAQGGYGWEVVGIRYATMGFLQNPIDWIPLSHKTMEASLIRQGGTILGSISKSPFFQDAAGNEIDRRSDILEGYHKLGLDALIVIGGDGSVAITRELAQKGKWNLIAIPKTIDNDLGSTERAIGFATAVEVATEALDRLQPTAASHDRVMVLEVMGRDAGHIALHTGIAGGADIVLIPEIPYSLSHIRDKIQQIRAQGRQYALVVVAEAVKGEEGEPFLIQNKGERPRYAGIGHYIAQMITEMTGAETRVTVLGHVQRGSAPGASDRILAGAFGVRAVDLIAEGKFDRMVAWRNETVVDIPIPQATSQYQIVDTKGPMVQTARGLGICFGDEV